MNFKELKERMKICKAFAAASIRRWFAPRTYVLAYSYRDKSKELHVDAKLVRAVVPSARDCIAFLQRDLGGECTDLRVLSFTEAPACLFNGVCIDAAEKLVDKADEIANTIKEQHDTKVVAEPVEDKDEDDDVSDMFR